VLAAVTQYANRRGCHVTGYAL